jgi:hypothetical protein
MKADTEENQLKCVATLQYRLKQNNNGHEIQRSDATAWGFPRLPWLLLLLLLQWLHEESSSSTTQ